MLGIVTSQLPEMKTFFTDVLGFEILLEMEGNYVEFKHDGVRVALSTHEVMAGATGDESYKKPTQGHRFELAFRAESPAAVDTTYAELIEKGAKGVKEPSDMPWNQRTAFFADPDGNVHEVFADLQ